MVNSIVKVLKDNGLLQRDLSDLGELFDLSIARGEFVRALGRTAAWRELVQHSRDEWPVLSWRQRYRLDAVWLRAWIGDVKINANDLTIGHILWYEGVFPEPDIEWLIRRITPRIEIFWRWLDDERAPDPISETREAFLERMSEAYDMRRAVIGLEKPRLKRDLREHAKWFVQHRVDGLTPAQISETYANPPELSTVRKSFATFAALIELPEK